MKALYFNKFGTSSVLKYGEIANPIVTTNNILLKMEYIGLNYADIYRRKGNYHIEPHTPYINGYEGVGTVVDIGRDVQEFNVGERVLFVDVPLSNAELVSIPKANAIKIPTEIDSKLAASIGLQGLTADFLAHELGRNKPDDNILIQGISGGVGQLLSQILAANNVNVYGVTSSQEKSEVALNQGAKKVFLRNSNWQSEYLSFFDTVYDGVGATLGESITLLKNKGKVVFFGMAGGNPPNIDFIKLLSESKNILTGDLWDYLTSESERRDRSDRLFNYFTNKQISISEPTVFSLSQGKEAHDFLESGKSIGKILLKP